jgi:crotonobetainyl-CoA:carnitine CoA-transferase CaiB-like acyl-CoA transferase
MGRPELAKDPRYADNVTRCAHADELDALIAEWFKERDLPEVMRLFDRANVVAGPVYDIRDIMADPHYQARENIVSVPDGDFGSVRMQNVAPRFSRTPGRVQHAGRDLGANNAEVLAKIGIGPDEQNRLAAIGVI